MRIRTTRQAQLIRLGIESANARGPRRHGHHVSKRDHPLTQYAFAMTIRRRNKPPAGVNEQLRVDHPERHKEKP